MIILKLLYLYPNPNPTETYELSSNIKIWTFSKTLILDWNCSEWLNENYIKLKDIFLIFGERNVVVGLTGKIVSRLRNMEATVFSVISSRWTQYWYHYTSYCCLIIASHKTTNEYVQTLQLQFYWIKLKGFQTKCFWHWTVSMVPRRDSQVWAKVCEYSPSL